MSELIPKADSDKGQEIINALISDDDKKLEKAGVKFIGNSERIRGEIAEYFQTLAFTNAELRKAYERAYEKLRNGDPEDAIELLNEDYSYHLSMDIKGSEQEAEKILRFISYLKHDFKKVEK